MINRRLDDYGAVNSFEFDKSTAATINTMKFINQILRRHFDSYPFGRKMTRNTHGYEYAGESL